jgi:hypothetical protein
MAIGFDAGTYNLVACTRGDGAFVHKREVNAFITLPVNEGQGFMFKIMKDKDVPIIERQNTAYVMGEAAVNMAYDMNLEVKRPMKDGCVNPRESEAFQIMSMMIHGLLDDVKQDKEKLFYCVPANAINETTDADFHQKLLGQIFKAYKSEAGHTVDANPINEALALVYAELGAKAYTGIGISFGAGMVNVCYSTFGHPAFKFAIVNSGDWIDQQAAKATNETPAFINHEKTKIDLLKVPTSLVERAVMTQYQLMMEKTVAGIKKGVEEAGAKTRGDKPVDVVIAGGTSLPNGFDVKFKEILSSASLPIKLGEIRRPHDALYSVARGCLIAAEAAEKS